MEEKFKKEEKTGVDNSNRFAELLLLLTMNEAKNCSRAQNPAENTVQMYVNIGPKLATKLLTFYKINRTTKKNNLKNIVNDMINGNWKFDASPIKFNEDNDLIDGEHRLKAIEITEKTFLFTVTLGLSRDVFKILDSGIIRSPGDVFQCAGIPNALNAASITASIYAFKNGKFSDAGNKVNKLSKSELLIHYRTLRGIQNSIKFAHKVHKSGDGYVKFNTVALFHYLFGEVDEKLAEDFMTQLATGREIGMKSPVGALRKKINDRKMDKNLAYTDKNKILDICYCWEKFINNETIKQIKLPKNYQINL
tara:strand:+ start:3586 stop:4509 length:924 start_codon:yes stop_codon:yes gene_type:complete